MIIRLTGAAARTKRRAAHTVAFVAIAAAPSAASTGTGTVRFDEAPWPASSMRP
jgi:hypothetical protein